MLSLEIPAMEIWNPNTEEFIQFPGKKLELEHSLVSIYKWESKWHVNFIGNKDLTKEMVTDYIKCMTITKGIDDSVYDFLTNENIKQVVDYIGDPMTATTFSNTQPKPASGKKITNELVYFWMTQFNIPFDPCEKWHFNRLWTLIRIAEVELAPKKKMSKRDIYRRNDALNAARRAKAHSKG